MSIVESSPRWGLCPTRSMIRRVVPIALRKHFKAVTSIRDRSGRHDLGQGDIYPTRPSRCGEHPVFLNLTPDCCAGNALYAGLGDPVKASDFERACHTWISLLSRHLHTRMTNSTMSAATSTPAAP
jgi:hypothetical protein